MSNKKAWIYTKIDAPEDSGRLLEKQEKELSEYAESLNFSICGVSSDIGPDNSFKRKGINNMINSIINEKIEVLLLTSLRLLSDDEDIVSDIISFLNEWGIEIYTPLEGCVSKNTYCNPAAADSVLAMLEEAE